MINPDSINKFLARSLDNWDGMKSYSEKELDDWIFSIDPNYKFRVPLYKHQKACFILGINLNQFIYFSAPGTGKTAISLNLLQYFTNHNRVKNALVVVPNIVLFSGWVNEAAKHAPGLNIVPLFGGTQDRIDLIRNTKKDSIFIINYQGLVYLCTQAAKSKKPGKKKKGKRQLDATMIKEISSKFDALILDEIHSIKDSRSLAYQVCNRLTDTIPIRYGLTGTPFGRNAEDLWSQFHAIDKGQTLGYTLGIYRESFFTKKFNYWGGVEYKLDKKMETTLHKMIKHRSIRYGVSECVDLPECIKQAVTVEMSDSAKSYYQAIIKDCIKDAATKQEQEVGFLRLRQISSGFLGTKDEFEEKVEIEFPENPKLDMLMELIDSIPEDCKLVIFHEFIFSGAVISRELTERKIQHSRLWSGTKDPGKELNQFLTNPDIRAFVVNSKSGGVGLNLQVANYAIFYESPLSPITRDQAEKRVDRTGQSKVTFLYDLVTKDTVDERILSFLKEGKNLFNSLIEGKAKWTL